MNIITETVSILIARFIAACGVAIIASAAWWIAAWIFPSAGWVHTVALASMVIGAFYGAFGTND
jgi:hypothetical protein